MALSPLGLTQTILGGGARLLANPVVQGFAGAGITKGVGSVSRIISDKKRHAPDDVIQADIKRESVLTLQSAAYSSILNPIFQKRIWPRLIKAAPQMVKYHELAYAAVIGVSILFAEVTSRMMAPVKDYTEEQQEMLVKLWNQLRPDRLPALQQISRHRDAHTPLQAPVISLHAPLMFADTFSRNRRSQVSAVQSASTLPDRPTPNPLAATCAVPGTFSL